jgi:hypothetical protein
MGRVHAVEAGGVNGANGANGHRHGWQQAVLAVLLTACGAQGGGPRSTPAPADLGVLDHARFLWVSAQCVDGQLDLAKIGFERTLTSEVHGRELRFTYDTRLAQPDCVSTEVWSLKPETAGQWRFEPESEVRMPALTACGAATQTAGQGVVQLSGDLLEELHFGSAWCRGFDVRFVYRRAPNAALSRDQIIRRYVAHWNRRDAHAVAGLFAEQGVLVEPFSRSADGTPVRHEGRKDVEAWLSQAFGSVSWLALQLSDIEPLEDADQTLAMWRYFDSQLKEPLAGRNLFLLAGGEIFTTELQLVGEPVPADAGKRAPP